MFFSSTKKGKISDGGKISNGQISLKDYLTCEKIWDMFDIKDMADYHDRYFEKMYCYYPAGKYWSQRRPKRPQDVS